MVGYDGGNHMARTDSIRDSLLLPTMSGTIAALKHKIDHKNLRRRKGILALPGGISFCRYNIAHLFSFVNL